MLFSAQNTISHTSFLSILINFNKNRISLDFFLPIVFRLSSLATVYYMFLKVLCVDTLTNLSSSIFQCKTKKTIKIIRKTKTKKQKKLKCNKSVTLINFSTKYFSSSLSCQPFVVSFSFFKVQGALKVQLYCKLYVFRKCVSIFSYISLFLHFFLCLKALYDKDFLIFKVFRTNKNQRLSYWEHTSFLFAFNF